MCATTTPIKTKTPTITSRHQISNFNFIVADTHIHWFHIYTHKILCCISINFIQKNLLENYFCCFSNTYIRCVRYVSASDMAYPTE